MAVSASRRHRWVMTLAMALVLIVVLASFAISFTVLRDLAALAGIPRGVAWLWPVITDGTIAAATLVLYASSQASRRAKLLPSVTLTLFALVSIVGNVAHILLVDALQEVPWPLAGFVGVVPPVGLLLTVEMLVTLLRSGDGAQEATVSQDAVQPELLAEPTPAHLPTRSEDVDRPEEPMDHVLSLPEPGSAHGSMPRLMPADPALEPPAALPVGLTGGTSTSVDPWQTTYEPTGPSDEPTASPALTPMVSVSPDEPTLVQSEQVDDPASELTAQPLAHPEPSVEPEPSAPEPAPVTAEDQVAWIAAQARAGEPVTASVLVNRFAEVGLELSLSTVKRRLSSARQEHPDAFEAAA